jgi:Lar family restriction alleviation protein
MDEATDARKPRSCPFCGGDARSYRKPEEEGGGWVVLCETLACEADISAPSLADAIAAWNRRA